MSLPNEKEPSNTGDSNQYQVSAAAPEHCAQNCQSDCPVYHSHQQRFCCGWDSHNDSLGLFKTGNLKPLGYLLDVIWLAARDPFVTFFLGFAFAGYIFLQVLESVDSLPVVCK